MRIGGLEAVAALHDAARPALGARGGYRLTASLRVAPTLRVPCLAATDTV